MSTGTLLLVLNAASTFYLVGLIWVIQIVQYPLYRHVGSEEFPTFHNDYTKRITRVVVGPMLIELVTAVLLIWFPPIPNGALLLLGVGLLFVIWVSTFLLQVPCHEELQRGFNPKVHRQLVITNWIRTVCWTLRGVLVGSYVVGAIGQASLT